MKKKKIGKEVDMKSKLNVSDTQFIETIYDEEEKKLTLKYKADAFMNNLGIKKKESFQLIINQIINTSIIRDSDSIEDHVQGLLGMYEGMHPKDELESLLTSQMVVTHNLAMEMCARSLGAKTDDELDADINRATKLMRTFTAQVETLKRYRIGGKQTIHVHRVNVNEGGQAVVGNIKGGGVDG
jgi:hypothetical protein